MESVPEDETKLLIFIVVPAYVFIDHVVHINDRSYTAAQFVTGEIGPGKIDR